MVVSFVLGTVYFVALVAAIAVGVGTLIVWIGVPILAMTMVAWRAAAGVERWRVWRMLGTEVARPSRPALRLRVTAPGERLRQWRTEAKDPASWCDLLYLFLMFPIGIAELVLVTAGFSLSIGLLVMPVAGPTGGSGISIGGAHFTSVPASIALGVLVSRCWCSCSTCLCWLPRPHAHGARLLLGGARESQPPTRRDVPDDLEVV